MYYPTTELNGLIKLEPQHLQHNTNSENLMQLGDNISWADDNTEKNIRPSPERHSYGRWLCDSPFHAE